MRHTGRPNRAALRSQRATRPGRGQRRALGGGAVGVEVGAQQRVRHGLELALLLGRDVQLRQARDERGVDSGVEDAREPLLPLLVGDARVDTYDNTSSLQQRLHQSTVHMPVGYLVSPNGRTGAELRVARSSHELVATGKSALLGKLLPHLTTTSTTGTERSAT